MNQRAWEHHLEQLPDELAQLRAEKLLLHSRLAKQKRRNEALTEKNKALTEQRDQALAELRWRRAKDHR